MVLVPLFLVVLLLLPAALVDGVAAPLLTFQDTDPITGRQVDCDRCAPGFYMTARCTSVRKSQCAPCPAGSYTELWNYISKCLRCSVCGHNQVVKTECSAHSDCQCECQQGYYYKKQYGMCLQHSQCQSGQGALSRGTAHEDTVCYACPNGTYSDIVSAHHNCTKHNSCHAAGLQLVLKGSTWHDSVCSSYEELRSRHAADYLKEILPSFFVHQKMSMRRLRSIVHKLPSEAGRKQRGASVLSLPHLQARINNWVALATAKQIQQLPEILTKIGANAAGEKLHNKLQRINTNLKELCCSKNEVEVV